MRIGPLDSDSLYQMSAPYCGLCARKNMLPVASPPTGGSPHWMPVRGANRCAGALATVRVICCSGAMSTIQIERPCVPAISSASRGWILRSCTGVFGKPVMKGCHEEPRSDDT